MVWEVLKQANQNNKSFATVWLDIANAYGSIPHQLILLALKRYGVSKSCIDLIKTYGRAGTALTWARMEFRAKKSRTLVIRDGNVTTERPFSVHHETNSGERVHDIILSIQGSPIQFLGRVNITLSDREQSSARKLTLSLLLLTNLGTMASIKYGSSSLFYYSNCAGLLDMRVFYLNGV